MSKKKKKSQVGRMVISSSNFVSRIVLDAVFYVFVAIFIYRFSIYARDFCFQLFGNVSVQTAENAVEKEIFIETGDSTRDIAKRLEREGLIVDELSFYVKVKINKFNIIPGTYTLRTDMNYNEILDIISKATEHFEDEENEGLPDE